MIDSNLPKHAEILPEFYRKSSMPSSQRCSVSKSGNNYNAMAASRLASSCHGVTLRTGPNGFLQFATTWDTTSWCFSFFLVFFPFSFTFPCHKTESSQTLSCRCKFSVSPLPLLQCTINIHSFCDINAKFYCAVSLDRKQCRKLFRN